MAVNSEPNEGSRKTLDEIRRELEAEYGFVEAGPRASEAPGALDDPDPADRPTAVRPPDEGPIEARLFRPRPQAPRSPAPRPPVWDDDDEVSDDRVEQLFERHQLAMGRRADDDERPRRSSYLVAALVGCIVGQAALLGFFLVTQHRLSADLLRTSAAVSHRVEATAPATPAAPAAAPAAGDESTPVKEESARPKEEPVQSIVSIPPDAEPPAATPADSSSAAAPPPPTDLPPRTTGKSTAQASRPARSDVPPALVTQEPARSPVRQRSNRDGDVTDAQARLRYALNEWLRTSAHGRAAAQTTEPVIVLGPDGRTAKTYVSVASPIGMIPREQRWQLGADGWTLVDDRQSGLPRPAGARDR